MRPTAPGSGASTGRRPRRRGLSVLAVDIPSGVDGLTGRAPGDVLAADATVTFAALKPGLVLPPGLELAGEVEVADIGLDVSRARPTSSVPRPSPAGCPTGRSWPTSGRARSGSWPAAPAWAARRR